MSIRVATLGTLLTALGLSMLLWTARPADAGPSASPPPVGAAVEDEIEEEELPEDECELLESWGEECEAEEEGEPGSLPPEECVLQSATARVLASRSRDRLLAVVRYTAVEPARVYLDLRFSSPRGTQSLGTVRRRLSVSGTIRFEQELPERRMEMARRARELVLTLDVAGAPASCGRHLSRHLARRRAVHGRVLWAEPRSAHG
jgi:hypothetical protein